VTKFILIVCALLLVVWLVKGMRRGNKQEQDVPEARVGEDMVRCAQCGVHLPRGESLVTQGQYYCSAEHRRQHQPES